MRSISFDDAPLEFSTESAILLNKLIIMSEKKLNTKQATPDNAQQEEERPATKESVESGFSPQPLAIDDSVSLSDSVNQAQWTNIPHCLVVSFQKVVEYAQVQT